LTDESLPQIRSIDDGSLLLVYRLRV